MRWMALHSLEASYKVLIVAKMTQPPPSLRDFSAHALPYLSSVCLPLQMCPLATMKDKTACFLWMVANVSSWSITNFKWFLLGCCLINCDKTVKFWHGTWLSAFFVIGVWEKTLLWISETGGNNCWETPSWLIENWFHNAFTQKDWIQMQTTFHKAP